MRLLRAIDETVRLLRAGEESVRLPRAVMEPVRLPHSVEELVTPCILYVSHVFSKIRLVRTRTPLVAFADVGGVGLFDIFSDLQFSPLI